MSPGFAYVGAALAYCYFDEIPAPCGPPDDRDDKHLPHWLRSRGHGHPGSKVPFGKWVAARRKKTKAAKRHKKYLKELARQKLNRKESVS